MARGTCGMQRAIMIAPNEDEGQQSQQRRQQQQRRHVALDLALVMPSLWLTWVLDSHTANSWPDTHTHTHIHGVKLSVRVCMFD